MSSSVAPSLIFGRQQSEDEHQHPDQALVASTAAGAVLNRFAPKLIALAGLALFGCALLIAFRIIALDAGHQLQQPGIDFAICGAIGFLGLCICWIHLGETQQQEFSQAAQPAAPRAALQNLTEKISSVDVPATIPVMSTPVSATPQCKDPHAHWVRAHVCLFCGQKMMSLGAALYRCSTCFHTEDYNRVSFLDGSQGCDCANCRLQQQRAV